MRRRKGARTRVLIVVQNLPMAVDRRVWLECQALVRAGYGVTVICPKAPGEPRYRVQDGVVVRSYRAAPAAAGPLGYAWEFLYCWLRTALLSVLVLVREGFDCLQACNPPDTFWALALPYRLVGKPFVYDQHDLCPEVFRARFGTDEGALLRVLLLLERCTYRVADRVLSTNGSYRATAITRGGVDPARISIVRSGPDADRMRRGEPSPELRRGRAHLCCYLGVMGPQDGLDTLLRSIDAFVHGQGRTDTTFALLGFGDCVAGLKQQCTALGLDEFVVFTGRADNAMIDRYLSTADLGLSSDPLNALNDVSTMNKTLEYMAYALPVVAYDLVETRVSAGECAVYVSPGDETGYAAAVSALLDDPQRRAELGAIGRRRIEQSLAWSYSEQVYVGVYDELLGVDRVQVPAQAPAPQAELGLDALPVPGAARTDVPPPPDQRAPARVEIDLTEDRQPLTAGSSGDQG